MMSVSVILIVIGLLAVSVVLVVVISKIFSFADNKQNDKQAFFKNAKQNMKTKEKEDKTKK